MTTVSTLRETGRVRTMSTGFPFLRNQPVFSPNDPAADAAEAEKAAAAAVAAKEASEKEAEEKAAQEAADREAAEKAALESTTKEALANEKAELLKEVMEKKNKMKAAEDRAAQLEADLKKFDGIDPEAVRVLLKEREDAENAELERKGEFDRLKGKMVEEHSKEVEALKAQIAELQGQTANQSSTIMELTVGQSFATSGFIKDDLVLTPTKARQLYGANFELVDGQTVGYDKSKGAADRTMLVDAKGDPLPFDEALKRVIDADPDKDTLYRAKQKPGAHSSSTPAADKTRTPETAGLHGASRIAVGLAKKAK